MLESKVTYYSDVTENGGSLSADGDHLIGDWATMTNTQLSNVELFVEGIKKLDGGVADVPFKFQVRNPQTKEVLWTVENETDAAQGAEGGDGSKIINFFPNTAYDKVTTEEYLIDEVPLDGYKCDTSVYHVKIEVTGTKNGDEEWTDLKATVTVTKYADMAAYDAYIAALKTAVDGDTVENPGQPVADKIVRFENSTEPKPGGGPGSNPGNRTDDATWNLDGVKLLDSAPAVGEQFTFTVDWTFTNSKGEVTTGPSYEVHNDGGVIHLVETQTYDTPEEVGTYVYTIREKAENGDGIIYDDVVYTVTVVVSSTTDTVLEDGSLVNVTTYAVETTIVDDTGAVVDAVEFNNATEDTDIPDDDTPLEEFPDDDVPLSDLPDDETPLDDIPDDEVPLSELPEPDVPLAFVPQTGDSSLFWLGLTLLSGLSLAGLALIGKKKEEQ